MSVDIDALKAAQARGLTVGVVPRAGGKPALRLEIDDFIQDTELANLYFLALEALMSAKGHEKPFSYHEICGIHGQPYRAWDGVTSANFEQTGRTNSSSGYCSHGSVIFPTWHRAYLAMYEVCYSQIPRHPDLRGLTKRPRIASRVPQSGGNRPETRSRGRAGSFPDPLL